MMQYTEDSVLASVTVLRDGQLQVRIDRRVLRGGQVIATTPHRHVVVPGASLEFEHPIVQNIGMAVHTPSVIRDYQEARAARMAEQNMEGVTDESALTN